MPSQPQPSAGSGWEEKESISRTMIYKKVTKPLLERQRRARINRCLDELKELMSSALAAEGENLTKLEKADVLELTVRHLHQLQREGELSLSATANGLFGTPLHPRSGFPAATSGSTPVTDRRRYQGGFIACAQQVASYVMKNQDLEPGISQRLLAHLARCAQQLSEFPAAPAMAQPFPVPAAGPAPEVPSQFLPFPAQDPVFPARQEYAITAQFQLYRSKSDIPASPMILSPPVPADPVKLEEKVPESLKRKADSPEVPRIPKKRYAHCSFKEEEACGIPGMAEPVAGTSRGNIYVVESRILEVPPQGSSDDSSEDDAASRDENMWRPW